MYFFNNYSTGHITKKNIVSNQTTHLKQGKNLFKHHLSEQLHAMTFRIEIPSGYFIDPTRRPISLIFILFNINTNNDQKMYM